jgi:adenylate cyclase
MPRLIARGPAGDERRLRLRPDHPVRLGRRPAEHTATEGWEVPWETQLSRDHADLRWIRGTLEVSQLDAARNPIFFKGQPRPAFTMTVGDHFVVGDTTFALAEDRLSAAADDPTPVEIEGYTLAEIHETRYVDADERLQVLATLPDVIRGAATDDELFSRLVLMVFAGISSARAAAIVHVADGPTVEVLHWDTRVATDTEFHPSRRLILEAVSQRGESVSSVWTDPTGAAADYTVAETLDWAFCTPVPGHACAGWGLYVAGRTEGRRHDLRPDVKFTGLVASLLGAMRDFQALQRQQTTLGRFFSPVALPMLTGPEAEQALEPRLAEVTVLFCDLRGFSKQAEHARDDLLDLLKRVSRALDVMTRAIHAHRGVIGDFQGDAALAFWGWPDADPASARDACLAAVEIRQRFDQAAQDPTDPLTGFRCGIGIATGEAVVGKLGTAGQFKIDVFGPVVNLASRLEGITKQLRVPILVDERTAERAGAQAADGFRFRRLARLRPYGLSGVVTASELLPASGDARLLDAAGVALYEQALDAFIAGRWDEAFGLLHAVPPWDHGKDFLTSHILGHRREPPPGWDGVIALDTK